MAWPVDQEWIIPESDFECTQRRRQSMKNHPPPTRWEANRLKRACSEATASWHAMRCTKSFRTAVLHRRCDVVNAGLWSNQSCRNPSRSESDTHIQNDSKCRRLLRQMYRWRSNSVADPGYLRGNAASVPSLPRCEMQRQSRSLRDSPRCERRLKSAARGGRKVQRWGWVVDRFVVCWPVMGSAVVAVDMK